MKTKTLLFAVLLFAGSLISTSAQRLLINEDFSTDAWEAEFLRLNPGVDGSGVLINPNAPSLVQYSTPAGAATFSPFNGIDKYFGKYELFSGAIECQTVGTLVCPDGAVHRNPDQGGVSVAWRLKRLSSGASWLTLPKIPNAGTFSVHIKNGGAACDLKLQRVDTIDGSPVITDLKTWGLAASTATKFTTQTDEVKTFWVDSRNPVTLRIGQATGGLFIKIFAFQVEEHASVPLKHSIDSATVIKAANVSNIGTGYGQYPQEAYDAFTNAITSATTIHDNLTSTSTQLLDGRTAMNVAITAFNDSKIVATGFEFSKNDAAKVYCLKGGLKISGADANTQVSIFSLTGNLVKQQTITDEANIYLPTGSYLVKLQNSNRVIKALVR